MNVKFIDSLKLFVVLEYILVNDQNIKSRKLKNSSRLRSYMKRHIDAAIHRPRFSDCLPNTQIKYSIDSREIDKKVLGPEMTFITEETKLFLSNVSVLLSR